MEVNTASLLSCVCQTTPVRRSPGLPPSNLLYFSPFFAILDFSFGPLFLRLSF